MLTIQKAIIDRIKKATDENGDLIFNPTSVAAYAGEISKDGIKTREKLPIALVMFRNGKSGKGRFDVLVITESQSFEKELNTNNNLEQSSLLLDYFSNYPGWDYAGKPYLINERVEPTTTGTVLQSNRHTVIAISIYVEKLI